MSKLQDLKALLNFLEDSKSEKLESEKSEHKKYHSRLEVGKNYLIRTVTMIQVGEFVEIDHVLNVLVLKNASWIADTGRFYDCLVTGNFNEVEPFPDWVAVGIGSIVDLSPFNHALPRDQK